LYCFGLDCDAIYILTGKFMVSTVEQISTILIRQGATLSLAESCTGGAIAALFTSRAGASAYFKGGVVAYSNEIKMSVLGVEADALAEQGAVSREVACRMADGVRRLFRSDYSIAATGIAGPDGGSPAKPVGTVWIAVSSPHGTITEKLSLGDQGREKNISATVEKATKLLLQSLIAK
jgi:nicotinamide-nucleotide amidase